MFLRPDPYCDAGDRGETMSRIAHNNKKLTLRSFYGIRARLVLLALILVAPLMADRVRVLEDFRDRQLYQVQQDVARPADPDAAIRVTADAIAHDISNAYLQLGLVCVFVLLGALVVAERIIIKPIEAIAEAAIRFGDGDWSARPTGIRLPAEFIPLARAFNRMTAQLRDRERNLLAANDRLAVMASSDMLSGLANRRGFQTRLDSEWAKAQQTGGDLAVMMIDVDHFKAFNDTYGHLRGDACLGRIGEVLAAIATDNNGFAGRYGGEEFCILLPGATAAAGHRAGEAVRAAVQALAIPHSDGVATRVTVSVGVASVAPQAAVPAQELMEAADAALYAAKHNGRNMVAGHGLIAFEGVPLALAG